MAAKLIMYVSFEVEVEIEDEILNNEVYDDCTTALTSKLYNAFGSYKAFQDYDISSLRAEPGVVIVQNGSGEPEIYDL